MGFGNLAKMAQQMQADMARVQSELESMTLEGTAGGGAVKAVVTGKQELVSIAIDPGVVDPDDVEMLQDLVTAAVNDGLRRARETAEIVAVRLGRPVETVEGLREIDVGEWQGLTRLEVEERFPEAFARWIDYGRGWEDGESYEAMGERVRAALRDVAARHRDGVVLVVTHGGPMRAAIAAAEEISHEEARRRGPPIGNCTISRIAVEDGVFRPLV